MASLNKIQIIGNLGADPESRFMLNGDAVCNLRIATTESYKDKSTGEKREITEWHRVVVFRKLAEICSQYLKKGSPVYIEGKIRTRKWQNKEGQDQYTTEIEANEMQMLGGRSEGQSSQPAQQASQRNAQGAQRHVEEDSDIPFNQPGMDGSWRVM